MSVTTTDRDRVYAQLADLIARYRFSEARDLIHELLEEVDR